MEPQYAHHHHQQQQQQAELVDPDEMQHMWQFLDSTLTTGTTPNGIPSQSHVAVAGDGSGGSVMMQAQYGPSGSVSMSSGSSVEAHPGASASTMAAAQLQQLQHQQQQQINEAMRQTTLNDDELGDVFSMFFTIDGDDTHQHNLGGGNVAAIAHAQAQQQHMNSVNTGGFVGAPRYQNNTGSSPMESDSSQKVQLARSASASSSHSGMDSISPGGLLGYPSMSPATMNWLQSLAKSTSSESLTGLVSPATLYGTPNALSGSASANSLADGAESLERTPSCEIIDWKAYNEAGEKAQKDTPKWRVIPQHGPHADPTTAANSNGSGYPTAAGLSTKPPTGSVTIQNVDSNGRVTMENAPTSEGGLRNHFTRQFQTIKSTVVSLVGALSAPEGSVNGQQYQATAVPQPQSSFIESTNAPPAPQPVLSQSAQEHLEQAAKKMAEEKNKRKAIISPEYVQYSSNSSSGAPGMANGGMYGVGETGSTIKVEPAQLASLVPDPTGRRSSKKILHQTGFPTHDSSLEHQLQQQHLHSLEEKDDPNSTAIRCKCTGKCRNARCACVKAGFVCGVHCKCVSCANPFVPMESEGIDIQKMVQDLCLMQFLSKVKDMQELLDSTVSYECCNGEVQVKKTIENGFACPMCQTHYTYSWCNNRLCNDQKKPRKHCAKCRRCGDHRNEHCDDCNHCYFAGVANSFSCSCKGGKTGANGVKARAVVPNINRDIEGGGVAKTEGQQQQNGNPAYDNGSYSRGENANPHGQSSQGVPRSALGGATIVDGLSNSEAEKDDECRVQ